MPVTAAEQRAYARTMRQITRRMDNLEDDTIRRMMALLGDLRRSIAAELTLIPDDRFDAFRLQQLSDNMGALVTSLEGQLVQVGNGAINGATQLGMSFVTEPLTAAGVGALFNSPNTAQVNVLLDFTADLIRGISAEMLQSINAQIRISALGQRSPFATMKEITRILGITGDKTSSIAYRAERIYRTETNRAFSLANESQRRALGQQIPGIQKRWLSTGDGRTRDPHLSAHGQIVAYDKPFIVKGEELQHPHDPAGSASNTINCRCRSETVHPDIGVISTPLDGRIEAEREKRNE